MFYPRDKVLADPRIFSELPNSIPAKLALQSLSAGGTDDINVMNLGSLIFSSSKN